MANLRKVTPPGKTVPDTIPDNTVPNDVAQGDIVPPKTPRRKTPARKTTQRKAIQAKADQPQSAEIKVSVPPPKVVEDALEPENRLAKADPNLFVRPWVALWRGDTQSAVINLEWEENHPTIKGRKIKASWKVTGDAELGLPTAGDRRLFNILCELTREQGMTQLVNFTRYDLLQRMGRGRGKRDYDLLLQSFERLKAVKITARNVFRDARTGLIEDAVFSIIDDVTIVKPSKSGRISSDELPLSTFSWSDRIYSNIQNGFLLTFDLNIAQSLQSDVALILYPLLLAKTYDGPGRRRSHFHSELRDFYENHLGMRSTRYVSKMEERLLPGHEELKEIGFLADAKIEPMKTKGQFKITYTLNLPSTVPALDPVLDSGVGESSSTENPVDAGPRLVNQSVKDQLIKDQSVNQRSTDGSALLPDSLVSRMIAIGIEERRAAQLEQEFADSQLQLQLDCLGDRNPRDPAALFLYALQRDLSPPATYLERMQRERQYEAQRAESESERQAAAARAKRAQSAQEAARRQIGTTTAFYESLSDRAKAIVRHRVDIELNQFGAQGRLLYPHPDWIQVLGSLLTDGEWAASLSEWKDDWNESSENEDSEEEQAGLDQTSPSGSLLSRLNLYVETLRALLHSGQADAQDLDRVREKSFPLLDTEEWEVLKERALSDR